MKTYFIDNVKYHSNGDISSIRAFERAIEDTGVEIKLLGSWTRKELYDAIKRGYCVKSAAIDKNANGDYRADVLCDAFVVEIEGDEYIKSYSSDNSREDNIERIPELKHG